MSNAEDNIEDVVDRGLEQIQKENIRVRKEFLDRVKRHGIGMFRALVEVVLHDSPEAQATYMTPQKPEKKNRRRK